MPTWCYFLFRVKLGERYDLRLPRGGLVIEAPSEEEAIKRAYRAADAQLPCEDGEVVVCHPVRDHDSCHHALLMHKDWIRVNAHLLN